MGLPEPVAAKYAAYTLFCHQMLKHLRVLDRAVEDDTRLTLAGCFERFNESLHEFFNRATVSDLTEAVEALGGLMHGKAGLFRRQNRAAAEVFDQVVSSAEVGASTWRYQDDIETYHQQGQELARRFFKTTPWPETRARLTREARLVFEYGMPDPSDTNTVGAETFGYRAAPLVYRATYGDEDAGAVLQDVIIVRFLFNHDLELYLAYPFTFLHEYTAHIFATDYGNDRFNDGWMLHAADEFLRLTWKRSKELAFLEREQVDVFREHLYGKLNPIPRSAYGFARDFGQWLCDWAPGRFEAMTYELAAFHPQPHEGSFWPTQLLNALKREYERDESALRRKIAAAPDLRTLYSILA